MPLCPSNSTGRVAISALVAGYDLQPPVHIFLWIDVSLVGAGVLRSISDKISQYLNTYQHFEHDTNTQDSRWNFIFELPQKPQSRIRKLVVMKDTRSGPIVSWNADLHTIIPCRLRYEFDSIEGLCMHRDLVQDLWCCVAENECWCIGHKISLSQSSDHHANKR